MISLDGSYLEGGGSIVRQALALAALTSKPFEVVNIRKNRSEPGLKAQHLSAVKASMALCNAKVEGDFLGSTYIKFIPGEIKGRAISIDIGTAGSITLLMQSVLLPSLFADAKTRFRLTGGTDAKFAQPWDYFAEVFLPQIRKFAESIDAKLIQRGYYPKGSGKAEIRIKPKYKLSEFKSLEEFLSNIRSQNLGYILAEQGHLMHIKGVSHASKDLEKAEVAERQASSAKSILSKLNVPVQLRSEYQETLSTGSGITLWAVFSKNKDDIDGRNPIRLGSDALGERGKRAEDVGKEAAEGLIKEIESRAAADHYLADQLVPFIALSLGSIKSGSISNHALTNIYVVEQFLGKLFDVDGKNGLIRAIYPFDSLNTQPL